MRFSRLLSVILGLATVAWPSGMLLSLAPQAQAATAATYPLLGSPKNLRHTSLSGDALRQEFNKELADFKTQTATASAVNAKNITGAPDSLEYLIQPATTWGGLTLQAASGPNAYVAWNDGGFGGSAIQFSHSTDGGKTWSTAKRVDRTDASAGTTGVALDMATGADGSVYIIWDDTRNVTPMAQMFYSSSRDGGVTWSSAAVLSSASRPFFSPPTLIADASGNIFAAWSDVRNGAVDVYGIRSADHGTTWQSETRISDTAVGTTLELGPVAAWARPGDITVGWGSSRNGSGGSSLVTDYFVASSADYGATFSANARINTNTAAGSKDLVDTQLCSNGNGRVYATYQNFAGGPPDLVYTAVSSDFGKTFAAPVNVTGSSQANPSTGSPFVFPADASCAPGTNNMIVTWQGGAAASSSNIMVARTIDGGTTWSTPQQVDLGLPAGGLGLGSVFNIIAGLDTKGHAVVTWTDLRNGPPQPHFNFSNDNGLTWQSSDLSVGSVPAGASVTFLSGYLIVFPWQLDNVPPTTTNSMMLTYFDARASGVGLYAFAMQFKGSKTALVRLAGSNRINTGIEISKDEFPTAHTATSLVLATSKNFPDGLAAGPLGATVGGSVLLNGQASLDAGVSTEIQRVLDGKADADTDVYIVGGPAAVSDTVVAAIDALPNVEVKRVSGANRYETAEKVAEEIDMLRGKGPTAAFLVNGGNFPDALASSAPASDRSVNGQLMPILLTPSTSLHASVSTYLTAKAATLGTLYVAGGTSAVSGAVAAAADAIITTVTRISGINRFATGVELAKFFYTGALNPSSMGIATGENFADALTGGRHSGLRHEPLVLVKKSVVPAETSTYVSDNASTIDGGFVYGGTSAVDDGVKATLETLY